MGTLMAVAASLFIGLILLTWILGEFGLFMAGLLPVSGLITGL